MITKEQYPYANRHGWSDVEPYEVVRVISDKTIEVRRMKYARDETFVPEWVAGGFAGVCTNQGQQKWVIEPDETEQVIRIRRHVDGAYRSASGMRFALSDKPVRFYDYNF